MKNLSKQIGALLVVVLLSGCASQSLFGEDTAKVDGVQPSGFLKDYSILREGGDGEAAFVFWNESANFAAYNAVFVDPITIWLGDDSSLNDVDPEQRQRLANEFHAAIIASLENDYVIADSIGPRTMRIRVALTDADSSSPVLDTLSTYIPQARLVQSVVSLGSETAGFVGKASAEAEILDASTGEILAAGLDRRAGTKALGDGTFDQWADVRRAFNAWSQQFASNLATRRR